LDITSHVGKGFPRDVTCYVSAAPRAALPREHSLIPCAEGLTDALRIITAGLLPQPSLPQKLGAEFPYRRRLFNLDVAEEAEALADGTGGAEFASGQRHANIHKKSSSVVENDREDCAAEAALIPSQKVRNERRPGLPNYIKHNKRGELNTDCFSKLFLVELGN
jgi:hypothetical protein